MDFTNTLTTLQQRVGDAMFFAKIVLVKRRITVQIVSRILDWFQGTVQQIVSKGL